MNSASTPGSTTALLLVDLQNDFIHPDGAYGRAGQSASSIAELPARLAPVADAARDGGAWVLATLFTLCPDRDGKPMVSPHLAELRPFLADGGFAPGSWGQQLVDDLGPAHGTIEKVAYSAFHQTRLEFLLRRAGIERLVVGGIVTNGGVASTVRQAQVLDFPTTVLSDGCAAFDDETHNVALASLATIATITTCAAAVEDFRAE